MTARTILVALAALALSACNTLGCGGSANGRAQGGGCGTHVTFLR
jgi:hypothetical protein